MSRLLKRCVPYLLPALLGGCTVAAPVIQCAGPDKPYQAVYSLSTGGRMAESNESAPEERVYADGRGHMRIDKFTPQRSGGASQSSTAIYDFTRGQKTSWSSNDKSHPTSEPLNILEVPYFDKNKLQQLAASSKSLANRNILGRVCQGYGGNDTEMWIDLETGCMMEESFFGNNTKVKSFSSLSPDASLFQIPAPLP